MAAALREALGVEATLVVGDGGEFTVWVDGRKVAEKRFMTFPAPEAVVEAVRAARAGA